VSDWLVVLVLALLAFLVSAVEVYRTRGQLSLAWATLALALAVLVDRLNR
jgi:hypothetical protein